MKRLLGAITSDCHLQTYNWARYPTLKYDSFWSFSQIVDTARSHEVPLFIAGDVLNKKRPDPETIGFLFDQIDRLERAAIRVLFTQGQHEMDRVRPWLNCHEWPEYIHKAPFELGEAKTRFYGLDYLSSDCIHEELDQIPSDTDVLISHQVWSERMGSVTNPEAAFADVPHVKMIVTGDFHGHRTDIFHNQQGNHILVVSPGSTYMQNLAEDNNKYFFLLYDDLTVESVPIKTRSVVRAEILDKKDVDRVFAVLQDSLKNKPKTPTKWPGLDIPIWHIKCSCRIDGLHDKLTKLAGKDAHLFTKVTELDTLRAEVMVDKAVSGTSLETYLPLAAKPGTSEFKTADRLLKVPATTEAIRSEVNLIVSEALKRAKGSHEDNTGLPK